MRKTSLIVVALMLLASNLLAADFVELKDVSGKHIIKVEIKKVANGKVQVTDEKGKTAEYPLSVFDRGSLILILNAVAKMKDIQKPNIPKPPMPDEYQQIDGKQYELFAEDFENKKVSFVSCKITNFTNQKVGDGILFQAGGYGTGWLEVKVRDVKGYPVTFYAQKDNWAKLLLELDASDMVNIGAIVKGHPLGPVNGYILIILKIEKVLRNPK